MSNDRVHKTICFVADRQGWAFERNMHNLSSGLEALGVHSTCYYQSTIPEHFVEDFIYPYWWPDVEQIIPRRMSNQHILCRVTDMATWTWRAPMSWQTRFQSLIPFVHTFLSASREIDDCLRSIGIHNTVIINDSVNEYTYSGKVFTEQGRPVVGWCGNPCALNWLGFHDVKGLSVLSVLSEVDEVQFFTASTLAPGQMPDWYRSVDVYVCASRFEGTPLSVLEAMSIGNIVLSTNVGVVPEIHSGGLFRFDGSGEDLKRALFEILRMRTHWKELAYENREYALKHFTPAIAAGKLHAILGGLHPDG